MCVCVCPCELVNVCDAACTAVSDVLRLSVCIPSRINLWLQLSCQRAGTRVSQAGESAGLALFCWRRGALQRLQDPLAPVSPVPQTDWEHLGSVSTSGPRRLSIYMTSLGQEWTGSGGGKIRALVPNTVCSLVRNTLYLLEVLYDSRRCTVDIDQCLVSCFL